MVRALVTGASAAGIGGAICSRLAGDGPARLAISATSLAGMQGLAVSLEQSGGTVTMIPGDLTEANFPGELVRRAADFCGGLDLVVSNAGRTSHGQLTEISRDDWDHALNLHARAAWLLARAAYPYLAKSRGAFIATGSVSGTIPHAAHGAYPVAKAALIMLCQTLALEWGPDGIRVNVVSPGLVATPASPKEYAPGIVPLGRAGTPEDIAATVAFLASPGGSYLTGQNIVADGALAQAALNLIPVKPHA